MKFRFLSVLNAGVALLAFAAAAEGQFHNPRFETGDLVPWNMFNTPNGQTQQQTVAVHDLDGAGPLPPSLAAKFAVGQVVSTPGQEAGIEIWQEFSLPAGPVTFECDVGAFHQGPGRSAHAGRFAITVNGAEIAVRNFGDIFGGGRVSAHLSGNFNAPANGSFRVGLRMTRHFAPATGLFQFVDNFRPEFDPSQFQNPWFESGSLAPWLITPTGNGQTTVQTVEVHDLDGAGPLPPSRAAKFSVGQRIHTPGQFSGIDVTQVLALTAGVYRFECDVGVFRPTGGGGNQQGGFFALFVEGAPTGGGLGGMREFGPITGQTHYFAHLSQTYEVPATGHYTVGVRIEREFLPPTEPLFQFVDNFTLVLVPPVESCDVLDFQSLEQNNGLLNNVGDQYEEDGYLFIRGAGPMPLAIFGTGEERYPGSTALFDNNTVGGSIVLRRIDGHRFNITGIDLANLNGAGPALVAFRGFGGPGGFVGISTADPGGLPNTLTRREFPTGFYNLQWLTWSQTSPFHQFDNQHVSTAATIDFEALRQVNNTVNNAGTQYEEDGYRITKSPGEPHPFATFGTQYLRFAGSTALFNNTINGTSILQRIDGGPFDLFEITLANFGDGPSPVNFVGTRIDGTTVLHNTNTGDPNGLPNVLRLNPFPTSFRLLRKVEWVQVSPFHQFDNIIVGCSNVCYGCDCDLSTGLGVCDIFDFLCFQASFDAADPYACDCDTGSGPGVCDIFDFLCFQSFFGENCGRNQ